MCPRPASTASPAGTRGSAHNADLAAPRAELRPMLGHLRDMMHDGITTRPGLRLVSLAD